jgi:hypothetical protein
MTDSVTLDIRPTAGHASATIADLIGDGFGFEGRPARRQRYVSPVPMSAVRTPSLKSLIDEVFAEAVLVPFELDWPHQPGDQSVALPGATRRATRFERQRQELDDRLQAMRATVKDVTFRVSMLQETH